MRFSSCGLMTVGASRTSGKFSQLPWISRVSKIKTAPINTTTTNAMTWPSSGGLCGCSFPGRKIPPWSRLW